MKQYLLFCWYNYYAQWGCRDFHWSFDTVEECEEHYKTTSYERMDIFDTKNNKIRYRWYKTFRKQ